MSNREFFTYFIFSTVINYLSEIYSPKEDIADFRYSITHCKCISNCLLKFFSLIISKIESTFSNSLKIFFNKLLYVMDELFLKFSFNLFFLNNISSFRVLLSLLKIK